MNYEKTEKTVKAFQWAWDVRRRIAEPPRFDGWPSEPAEGSPCGVPSWFIDNSSVHYEKDGRSFKASCKNPIFYQRINYGRVGCGFRYEAQSGHFFMRSGRDHPIKRGSFIIKDGDSYHVIDTATFEKDYILGAELFGGDSLCTKKEKKKK